MEFDDVDTENFEASLEGDYMTPSELLLAMEKAWTNEKFAPEILPHKMDLVEDCMAQIKEMQKNIDAHFKTQSDYKRGIHQLEVERIRFLVTSYLRFRLEKIELYVTNILQQEQQRQERGEKIYLTEPEIIFAQEYFNSVTGHLEKMKSSCPGLPKTELKNVAPNMHSMVFVKSQKAVEGILVEDGNNQDGDLIDLNRGSKILISYNSVANLVKTGDVHLI